MSVDGIPVLRGAHSVIVVVDHFPVDPVPPALEVLGLTANTVVHHPHVLPGVDTQNGLDIKGARCEVLLVLGVSSHGACKLIAQGSVRVVGSHVDRLPPGVRSRVGRTGVVCAEDVQEPFPLEVLGQPDESRTEHSVSSGQEVELQRFY